MYAKDGAGANSTKGSGASAFATAERRDPSIQDVIDKFRDLKQTSFDYMRGQTKQAQVKQEAWDATIEASRHKDYSDIVKEQRDSGKGFHSYPTKEGEIVQFAGVTLIGRKDGKIDCKSEILGDFTYDPEEFTIKTLDVGEYNGEKIQYPYIEYDGVGDAPTNTLNILDVRHRVKLPDGLKSSDYTFTGCEQVHMMPDLPDSLETMRYAFKDCKNLDIVGGNEGVTLPPNIRNRDCIVGAFSGSKIEANDRRINLPVGLTSAASTIGTFSAFRDGAKGLLHDGSDVDRSASVSIPNVDRSVSVPTPNAGRSASVSTPNRGHEFDDLVKASESNDGPEFN